MANILVKAQKRIFGYDSMGRDTEILGPEEEITIEEAANQMSGFDMSEYEECEKYGFVEDLYGSYKITTKWTPELKEAIRRIQEKHGWEFIK